MVVFILRPKSRQAAVDGRGDDRSGAVTHPGAIGTSAPSPTAKRCDTAF